MAKLTPDGRDWPAEGMGRSEMRTGELLLRGEDLRTEFRMRG